MYMQPLSRFIKYIVDWFFKVDSVTDKRSTNNVVEWWEALVPNNIRHSFYSEIKSDYRKIFNIRRTKSPNLSVSRLVLQLYLPNPMKPGVKPRMKM